METAFLRSLESAPAGSDLQLEWYFALLRVARSPHTLELFAGLLDGSREIEGLRIDQDRRWEILWALAKVGAPGARQRIAAELAKDATDMGEKAAIAAEV